MNNNKISIFNLDRTFIETIDLLSFEQNYQMNLTQKVSIKILKKILKEQQNEQDLFKA